jgi:hypothetical protein
VHKNIIVIGLRYCYDVDATRVAAPWYHLLWPLDLINNREFILQMYANVTADVLLIHGKKYSLVPS